MVRQPRHRQVVSAFPPVPPFPGGTTSGSRRDSPRLSRPSARISSPTGSSEWFGSSFSQPTQNPGRRVRDRPVEAKSGVGWNRSQPPDRLSDHPDGGDRGPLRPDQLPEGSLRPGHDQESPRQAGLRPGCTGSRLFLVQSSFRII